MGLPFGLMSGFTRGLGTVSVLGFESEADMGRRPHWIWFRYSVWASVRERAGFGFVAWLDYW